MSGTLYIIGTPIGNLEDITMRQLRLLGEVDFLAAEDTRVTRKLLSHYDIHTPIVSYHEHSGLTVAQSIADRILAGKSCNVVTDAGMPCISDPGEPLAALSPMPVQLWYSSVTSWACRWKLFQDRRQPLPPLPSPDSTPHALPLRAFSP